VGAIREGRPVHALKVVLACGGVQRLPQLPPPYVTHQEKIMLADTLLKVSGVEQLREKLVRCDPLPTVGGD
jgi:hypothetical protein